MFEELPAEENGFINPAAGKNRDEFQEWLKRADACSRQTEILDGWKVPETIFVFFEDDRPVGFGKLRHCLTDRLLEEGGNTGYCIRPSERNRGLGKKFLARLVEEGKKMGMDSFLLIIHNDNQPSLQVALANGGQIQKITKDRNYIWIGAGMTKVYFVRHAQPDHGWEEDRTRPLTEEGKRDSKIVMDTLREKEFKGGRTDMQWLATEDIQLKKGTYGDWRALYKNILSREESAQHMLWSPVLDEEHARKNIRKTIEFQKSHDAWLVYEKGSGQAIGWAGVDGAEKNTWEDSVWSDTGIAIGPDFTGKGYGKQILQCLIRYVFGEKRADRFRVSCRSKNAAARALCQSLGFSCVDTETKTDPHNGEEYVLEYYELERRGKS